MVLNRVYSLLACWSRCQKTLGQHGRFSVTLWRTLPTHSPASQKGQQTVSMTLSVIVATLGQSHPQMERYSQRNPELIQPLQLLVNIHFRCILTVLFIQVVLKAMIHTTLLCKVHVSFEDVLFVVLEKILIKI